MSAHDDEYADYRWLVSDEVALLLREIANASTPLHAQAQSLRRDWTTTRVHLLLEQVELRRRAKAKFPQAERMYFTPLGLEQATDAWVAAYKATRFDSSTHVGDLCCGIGGDLLAICQTGASATGVDLGVASLCLAEANAKALGFDAANFQQGDATAAPVEAYDAWHIDPDRRPQGKRTTRVELHSPSAAALDRLVARNPAAAIKLAPAAEVPSHWLPERELEWISRGGECKQLVVWSGSLAKTPGQRRATVLSSRGEVLGSFVAAASEPAPLAPEIGESAYEPDAAVFAAGLDGAVAREADLGRISSQAGYLTGPRGLGSPVLTEFVVEQVTPLRSKQLKSTLTALGAGHLEIKQRGVQHDLITLRKQLKTKGDRPYTLLLTRVAGKQVAIIAHRSKEDTE